MEKVVFSPRQIQFLNHKLLFFANIYQNNAIIAKYYDSFLNNYVAGPLYFVKIVQIIDSHKCFDGISISPSIVRGFIDNTKIKPFCNHTSKPKKIPLANARNTKFSSRQIRFINHKLLFFDNIYQNNNKLIKCYDAFINNYISCPLYFNKIVQIMTRHNSFDGISVSPSIVRILMDNMRIRPFWNQKIKRISDKLFLPSIDNIRPYNGLNKSINSPTWFGVDEYIGKLGKLGKLGKQKKYYGIKTKEEIVDDLTFKRVRQIKLYFNTTQKKYMKQIFGTYRYYYNRVVSILNNYNKHTQKSWYLVDPRDPSSKVTISVDNIYSYITLRPIIKKNPPQWLLKNFPSHLIDQAIIECINRFKTAITICKKYGKSFEFKYKKKTKIIQTINLEGLMINPQKNSLFYNWKIDNKYVFRGIKTAERLDNFEASGCSISYHIVLKKYILNMPLPIKNKKTANKGIASVDPGIRCLQIYILQIK